MKKNITIGDMIVAKAFRVMQEQSKAISAKTAAPIA